MKRYLYTLLCTLLLAVGCSKSDGDPTPPESQVAEQTLLMYFPWSGNLTSFFLTNIEDMKSVIAKGTPENCRVLVFLMQFGTGNEESGKLIGDLFELVEEQGKVVQKYHKHYLEPAITTAEGIRTILRDVQGIAPAKRYAMTIGSHGMAWLPAQPETSTLNVEPSYASEASHAEYWEQTTPDGLPITRWFGGTSEQHRTDISTLAEAIAAANIHFEYILFDDCYMSSIEVAYELRHVTDHLIASPNEIMAYGFPYAQCGRYMIGEPDYEGICRTFYNFYLGYVDNYGVSRPYGTIAVTRCAELEGLARVMQQINAASKGVQVDINTIQRMDGYHPQRFVDYGDYVRTLCSDEQLMTAFEVQLERTVPSACRRHTPRFYTQNGTILIETFTGLTTSDPSTSELCLSKDQTSWWKATH